MATQWQRLWQHFVTDRGDVARALSSADMNRIEQAVRDGEKRHGGQICFAVEAALPLTRVWSGITPRERALEVFSLLRVWDTAHNDGVLVYLLLADKDVEIVADRGIHSQVGEAAWETICRSMEAAFRQGRHADAVIDGINQTATLLAAHSPRRGDSNNELSDRPIVL